MKRSSQGDYPDSMDRLLSNLPNEPIPADLTTRIYSNILAHHRRHVALHYGVSALLAITGIWLALPGLAGIFQDLALPQNGWVVVTALLEMAGTGATRMSVELISILSSFQAYLSDPFNGVAWIGIITLAGGCLIALEQLLPRSEV